MTWTSDDGRKDGTRRVIAGKSGFAHAGAIVADQRSNLVVAHFHWIFLISSLVNRTVLARRLMPLVDMRPPCMSLYIGREPGAVRAALFVSLLARIGYRLPPAAVYGERSTKLGRAAWDVRIATAGAPVTAIESKLRQQQQLLLPQSCCGCRL